MPTKTEDTAASILAAIMAVHIAAVIVVALTLYEAACIIPLWRWFVAEPFAIKELTYPLAIGIATLTGLLTAQAVPMPKETKSTGMQTSIMRPAMCLLIGYIAHKFISA